MKAGEIWRKALVIGAVIALGLFLRHAPHCRPFPTHQTYLEPKAEQCGRHP